MRDVFEDGLEKAIFASRWILAPMYLGLAAALIGVTIKFFIELAKMVTTITVDTPTDDITVGILTLIDIALLGNLILIVIFAGYENFVSKIKAAADSEDRPSWMGHVDFSGLKMKLIGSLVAISVILLLKDFVAIHDEEHIDYEGIAWRIGLHLTFTVSGVLFSIMDYMAAKREVLLVKAHVDHPTSAPARQFEVPALEKGVRTDADGI
ncbi:TIGR00645 family protein [Demequina salsinemoris]|uniref:TIGR00645 family protein n=1 Tax=Demequina salsinemoris TaxID=577470 RepID=UPI000AFF16F4|nr:TIGR00645 family protein [Demequina salsinemoris]